MTRQASGRRGDWVLAGELVNMARNWGGAGNTTKGVGRAWSWVKAHNQMLCESCGHDRLNHLGFHEPGCSYLGSCSCPAFQLTSERTA